jgi:hypothetical protein
VSPSDRTCIRIQARVGACLAARDLEGAQDEAAAILQPLVLRANSQGCGGAPTAEDVAHAKAARAAVKAKFAQFGLSYPRGTRL